MKTRIVPFIALAAMSTLAGCVAESGTAEESVGTQGEALVCPNQAGTNAAIAAFAVAYGTEAHRWQILADFVPAVGSYNQQTIAPSTTGKCANHACPMTEEILRYADAKMDGKVVYDGQVLSAYNFASRLYTGYQNMQSYKSGGRFPVPAHKIDFLKWSTGTICSTDVTYSAHTDTGGMLSNPDLLTNALRFADGNGVNPYLFVYDSANQPHVRFTADTVTVDPTGGTSGDGSTSTNAPAAGCQAISRDKVNFKISTNPDVFVVGNGYSCDCPERGITNSAGHMRLDDPSAPNTFFCRTY